MLSFIWAGASSAGNVLKDLSWFHVPAFSALRVFAISGRDWRMSGFVFALSLVPVGTNLVSPSQGVAVWVFLTFTFLTGKRYPTNI